MITSRSENARLYSRRDRLSFQREIEGDFFVDLQCMQGNEYDACMMWVVVDALSTSMRLVGVSAKDGREQAEPWKNPSECRGIFRKR